MCATVLAAIWILNGAAQSGVDPAMLKRLFPAATAFSPKGGDPPHIRALVGDPKSGAQTPIGLAFWTTELEPLERGYDGPIKILVGVNPKGTGWLDPAAYERTVKVLLSGQSTPVITKEPQGAWTHEIWEKAMGS